MDNTLRLPSDTKQVQEFKTADLVIIQNSNGLEPNGKKKSIRRLQTNSYFSLTSIQSLGLLKYSK